MTEPMTVLSTTDLQRHYTSAHDFEIRGVGLRVLYQESGTDPDGRLVFLSLRRWTAPGGATDMVLEYTVQDTSGLTKAGVVDRYKVTRATVAGDTLVFNLPSAEAAPLIRAAVRMFEALVDGKPIAVLRANGEITVTVG